MASTTIDGHFHFQKQIVSINVYINSVIFTFPKYIIWHKHQFLNLEQTLLFRYFIISKRTLTKQNRSKYIKR